MREVDREAGQVRRVVWSLQEVSRHLESLGRLGEEGWPLPEEAWARWGHTSHQPPTRLGLCEQMVDLRGDFSSFVTLTKVDPPPGT